MSDISFSTACKELKIAQIAQLNQLVQLLHLAHIYGHCFYLVSRMLLSKNVNNDVSKDSPIGRFVDGCCPGPRLPNQWQSYLQFLSTNKLKTFTRFMEIMKGGENLVTMENNTHIIKPLVDSFHVLRFIHFKAVMTGSIWYQPWDIPPQHSSNSLIRFLLG